MLVRSSTESDAGSWGWPWAQIIQIGAIPAAPRPAKACEHNGGSARVKRAEVLLTECDGHGWEQLRAAPMRRSWHSRFLRHVRC